MKFQIKPFISICFAALLFSGCNQHPGQVKKQVVIHEELMDKPLPIPPDTRVVDISEFKKTAFVPTLENKIDNGKNTIYTPSFLFAWKRLKTTINRPIKVDASKEPFLALINKSESFQGSIEDAELHDSVFVMDDGIKVSSFFSKSLPFVQSFDKLEHPLLFSNQKVSSYGINDNFTELAGKVEILYYKNDNCFVIRLETRDTDEIILAKGMPYENSLGDYVKTIARLREVGKKENRNKVNSWKYHFNIIDSLAIPVIKFNIKDEYDKMIGENKFSTVDIHWKILAAEQQTFFLLNKDGAAISSSSTVAAVTPAPLPQPKLSPKRLVFDSPFIVVLKHKSVAYPYFVARIVNAELMLKEK